MKAFFGTLVVLSFIVIAPASIMAQENANAIVFGQFEFAAAATITRTFELTYPNQVYRARIYCADSTTLKISVADFGFPGDHWKATASIYDKTPAKKSTTCTGVLDKYSPVIVMKSGGVMPLQVLVEVRYVHGINTFPAAGYLKFEYNGATAPVVTEVGVSDF